LQLVHAPPPLLPPAVAFQALQRAAARDTLHRDAMSGAVEERSSDCTRSVRCRCSVRAPWEAVGPGITRQGTHDPSRCGEREIEVRPPTAHLARLSCHSTGHQSPIPSPLTLRQRPGIYNLVATVA